MIYRFIFLDVRTYGSFLKMLDRSNIFIVNSVNITICRLLNTISKMSEMVFRLSIQRKKDDQRQQCYKCVSNILILYCP